MAAAVLRAMMTSIDVLRLYDSGLVSLEGHELHTCVCCVGMIGVYLGTAFGEEHLLRDMAAQT